MKFWLILFAALCIGAAPKDGPHKGLAMAMPQYRDDLIALNVDWYYIWSWCDAPGCIPMVRSVQLPPSCPAYLLVGNEPNTIEPYGAPVTPAVAASRVQAIENACPMTYLVVGNVSADDWSGVGGWGSGYNWLHEFLRAYYKQTGRFFSQTIGVHCYSNCLETLPSLRNLYGGPMWVTEFNDPHRFKATLDYIDANFAAYAVYTNRQPHTGQGWEIAAEMELVDADGMPTVNGRIYAEWPMVNRMGRDRNNR
jgi:hypothetical protein